MRNWQHKLFSIGTPLALLAAGMVFGQSHSVDGGEPDSDIIPRFSQRSIQLARAAIVLDGQDMDEDGGQTPFVEEAMPEPPMPGDVDAIATDDELAPMAVDSETPVPFVEQRRPAPLPEEIINSAASDPAYETQQDIFADDGMNSFADDGMNAFADDGMTSLADMLYATGSCGSRGVCQSCSRRGRGFLGGVTVGGWLAQGITVADHLSTDRFNGPVSFNDRDGEYQANQLWVFAEKETNTGGCGWDVGGRVDFLYGTDWRFTQANGLEDNWNDSHRFYGAALPQVYMDVAINNLTVRMGHFYTIIGYEVVPATDNFFYSHTYAKQYGEPFTHTGLLGTYEVDRSLTVSAGFGRGWNNWEDNNSDLSFLGGVTTTSCDGRSALSLALSTGDYDDASTLNRTMYSLVFSRQASDRLSYVIQYDWGRDQEGGRPGFDGGWYGINNEMFYCVNDEWDVGMRGEWFRDADGTRVGGIGAPNGWNLGPDIDSDRIGWAGTFWEITIGANWSPYENVVVRPECRWDWYSGPRAGGSTLPFNSGKSLDQFTFATDLVISF